MDQRLSIITLGVSDLNTSRAFYEALGWRVAGEDGADKIVAFNLKAMALALFPREELAGDAGVEMNGGGKAYAPFTLAYNVASEDEVDAVLKQAEECGATIIKPAQKVFWGGYSGYFADPDGFLWEVAYNPFSKLKDDGSFQWG